MSDEQQRRGVPEGRARRLAHDRNALRKPGDPIWTAYRLDPPDGKLFDVGTVTINLPPKDLMPVRDFDEG